jgi:hypothetical protein
MLLPAPDPESGWALVALDEQGPLAVLQVPSPQQARCAIQREGLEAFFAAREDRALYRDGPGWALLA